MSEEIIRISYQEIKAGHQSSFRKIVVDASTGETIFIKNVFCPLNRVEEDGYQYFILYNDNMQVIRDSFEYLNYDIGNSPLTTRKKAAYALRLLYCFLELSAINVRDIDVSTIRKFQRFLQGLGVNDSGSLGSTRSVSTINGYFATYRSYFACRHIQCDALFDAKTAIVESVFSGSDYASRTGQKKYKTNLTAMRPNEYTVPKYIGPEDFKKLYSQALAAKDNEACILEHLMYGYGLRLGECLGITTEDITEVKIDGVLVPVIYIRNRMSDKVFQFAKGLMHVSDPAQYRSSDYQKSKHRIIITYDMYEQIVDYINEVHEKLMEEYPDNYAEGYADIVSFNNKPEENHYVFLNRYGRVLSDQTWNNKLKAYFQLADIPIDAEIRENNLSHRFRHGFAMFHAKFSPKPVGVLELQKLMRHKSVKSTMVYYNPTPEDELKTKTEFQTELYELIPELKKGWKNAVDNTGNSEQG